MYVTRHLYLQLFADFICRLYLPFISDNMKYISRLFACLFAFFLSVYSYAQPRRTPVQMKAALSKVVGVQRAQKLATVAERPHLSIMSHADAGFAVVSHSTRVPAVLAYGDQPFDESNPSPEFLYLMELYETAIAAAEASADAPSYGDDTELPQGDETWTNVNQLLTTHWAQTSPYNDQCPKINGTRCVTGCVATAMAQVLNYHKLPRTMHGRKTYGYTLDGVRYNNSFDFGANSFDWNNMVDTYNWQANSTQRSAVAKLMYACGVATGMRYTTGESGANTWVGTDAINYFMDGIRAEHHSFDKDIVLRELKAGRPVIYSGTSNGGGAHCFVIDGCTDKGYFHCNLGWGGGGDGNYLPTDMCGYGVSGQAIEIVYPSNYVPSYTPIAELQGKYAMTSSAPATSVEANRWYVLWNAGRSGSPISNGVGKSVTNTSGVPTGDATEYCANQLVRFVSRSGGGFYIQTGVGDYLGNVTMWGDCTTTSGKVNYFTVSPIKTGYFAIHSNNASCYVDTNGPGSTIVGWGNTMPTDTVSNSSWRIYPVTISDANSGSGLGIGEGASFDASKHYTLRNTGYSQGYLVALDPADEHPTLRGVTQNHSNGLYTGAAYHDAPDVYNLGYYWQIFAENGKQFLYNCGTQKYLTNKGDQTGYVFTDAKTPINIAKMPDGTYRFNAGSEGKSYLCAATQLANPAGFWTYDDPGSIWKVEETEIQQLSVPVQAVTLSETEGVMFGNARTFTLTANVLPANATNPEVKWTTSNYLVAQVNATGTVTSVTTGEAIITATSVADPTKSASFTVKVVGLKRQNSTSDLVESKLFVLRNVGAGTNRYSQGYLVATGAEDAHPTLRGVEVVHPTHGCTNAAYLTAPDCFSPYTYWQVFTKGADSYLYNVGVGKFLTNEGDRTPYVFTSEPTPIRIMFASTGSFYINSGSETQSYLCAATHLDNPAAYWTTTDVGTYWSIESVERIEEVLPDGIVIRPTTLEAIVGGTVGIDFQREFALPSDDESPVFDLQGRRVSSGQKGLFIQNGQKGVLIQNGRKVVR